MALLSYRRHRFPPPIIQHAIWLYLRFTLSYRDVDELLAERGLEVSYETVRRWVLKFGATVAQRLRRRRPRPSDRWHLDEMVVRIAGRRMYLWRAVDHEGEILDMLVQRRRNKRAALRLMRRLLRKHGVAPKLVVTDKLRSYGAAFRDLRLTCGHTKGSAKIIGPRTPTKSCNGESARAAVQVGSIRAALPKHTCRRPQYVQPSTPSHLPVDAADLQSRSGSAMVRRRCSDVRPDQPLPPFDPLLVAVTKPALVLFDRGHGTHRRPVVLSLRDFAAQLQLRAGQLTDAICVSGKPYFPTKRLSVAPPNRDLGQSCSSL
jgi:transposase-like protein